MSETENKLLVFENINKNYGKTEALKNINLTLPRNKIIGLFGPNGSGKTTMIKIINGLLKPSSGKVYINGLEPCAKTKAIVSYLPDASYLNDWMKIKDIIKFFDDFYEDFDSKKALDMVKTLGLNEKSKLKSLSKGNKDKVQLVLVMSRAAQLYVLDEPIVGVDPSARDYILDTILTNYIEGGTLLLSTHLIADIERIVDEAIFIKEGEIFLYDSVDNIIETQNKSLDEYFREVFKYHVGGSEDVKSN